MFINVHMFMSSNFTKILTYSVHSFFIHGIHKEYQYGMFGTFLHLKSKQI